MLGGNHGDDDRFGLRKGKKIEMKNWYGGSRGQQLIWDDGCISDLGRFLFMRWRKEEWKVSSFFHVRKCGRRVCTPSISTLLHLLGVMTVWRWGERWKIHIKSRGVKSPPFEVSLCQKLEYCMPSLSSKIRHLMGITREYIRSMNYICNETGTTSINDTQKEKSFGYMM